MNLVNLKVLDVAENTVKKLDQIKTFVKLEEPRINYYQISNNE
jgi:hypothetical protein